nr:MAG TPA: hypothetical protein [Bacteriophage sp.]
MPKHRLRVSYGQKKGRGITPDFCSGKSICCFIVGPPLPILTDTTPGG